MVQTARPAQQCPGVHKEEGRCQEVGGANTVMVTSVIQLVLDTEPQIFDSTLFLGVPVRMFLI